MEPCRNGQYPTGSQQDTLSNLTLWGFVAAEIFLGFSENYVLSELGAVLAKAELVRGVHGIFGCVIDTLARLFTDETNYLALVAFFCHRVRF